MNAKALLAATLVGIPSAGCQVLATPPELAVSFVDLLSAGCADAAVSTAPPDGDAIRLDASTAPPDEAATPFDASATPLDESTAPLDESTTPLGASTAPSGANQDPTRPDAAIRQLHADVDAAWNRADAAAMAAFWSVAGTNVSPMGVVSEGRDAIAAELAAGFAEGLAGSEHRLTLDRIYWVGAGLAVSDGEAEISNLVAPDGTVYPPLSSKFTSVSVRQPSGEWRLEHLRAYIFLQPGS